MIRRPEPAARVEDTRPMILHPRNNPALGVARRYATGWDESNGEDFTIIPHYETPAERKVNIRWREVAEWAIPGGIVLAGLAFHVGIAAGWW